MYVNCVDRPSRAGLEETEPASDHGNGEEDEDEIDLGRKKRDDHHDVGVMEPEGNSNDELEPVIITKKRQRKSQGSGMAFQSFYLECSGLKNLLAVSVTGSNSSQDSEGDHKIGFYKGCLRDLLMLVQLQCRRATATENAFPCPVDNGYSTQMIFDEQVKSFIRRGCA